MPCPMSPAQSPAAPDEIPSHHLGLSTDQYLAGTSSFCRISVRRGSGSRWRSTTTDNMNTTHLSHREVNKDNQSLCNTEPSAYSSKKYPPLNQNHLYLNVFTDPVTFTLVLFPPQNLQFSTQKMFKLLSNPASPKTPVGLELHSISHQCVCNVHGKGKRLSSAFQEAKPLPLQTEPVPSEAT